MSEPPVSSVDVRTGPFQFSLKTALVVMTGTSVILSLGSYWIEAGISIGVPLVSAWWTVLAIRAGRRRLAYYLASLWLGLLAAFLFQLPLCWLSGEWTELFVDLPSCMVATFLCAVVMRRWIRRPGTRALIGVGVVCAYLGATARTLLALQIGAIQAGESFWDNSSEDVGLSLFVTFTLVSTALPLAAAFNAGLCAVLRAVHPLNFGLQDEENAVFDAIAQLQWEEREAVLEEILARTGLTPQRAGVVLEQLVKKRVLRRPRRSEASGYRLC